MALGTTAMASEAGIGGNRRVISEEAQFANAFGRVARPHAPGESPHAGGSSHMTGRWLWGGSCVYRL